MARDDYHVIVYQILAYLYVQLKNGDDVDPACLKYDSDYLRINKTYWIYIIDNLLQNGLITGPVVTKTWGQEKTVSSLERAQITPKGIEYLCDNSFMEKAKQFLKDVKAIVPFF